MVEGVGVIRAVVVVVGNVGVGTFVVKLGSEGVL